MKVPAIVILVVIAGVLITLSICEPTILSQNEFLKGFITHELLGIMAVVMTISMTTIATIHIWFNELENKHGKRVFGRARKEINSSIFHFIGIFALQLFVLIVRSIPFFKNDVAVSLFNSASLILLLITIVTLLDIMGVVRKLTPEDE
jgi:hypothetical protein